MAQKIRKFISIIMTLALLISGTLILPSQALATTSYTISGTISLPQNVTAPAGGIEGTVDIFSNNHDNYSGGFTIHEGSSSGNYTVTVTGDNPATEYRVSYHLNNPYPGYVANGYYSTDGMTDYNNATLVNGSSGNMTGIDLTIFTGNTISGTISLPQNVTAPAGGLVGNVNISSSNGGNKYHTRFTLIEGSNTASYSATVSSEDGNKEYRVSYNLNNSYPGYIGNGYYSEEGTTADYSLATLVDASTNIEDINLTIFTGTIISGTVSLPGLETAPSGGLEGNINIYPQNGGNGYYAHFKINAGASSVDYTVTVPANQTATGYRVSYYLYSNYGTSGYLGNGYYITGGTTTDYSAATLVEVGAVDVSGIDLTLLKGTIISGTVSLPGLETAPSGGLEGSVNISPQNGGIPHNAHFKINAGASSVTYTATVPANETATDYSVSYYLYENYSGYVRKGYYSSAGTTPDSNSATPVDVSTGDAANIDLTLLKVVVEGLSATPVVKIGVNPSAGDIAGMFIGLDNIVDSDNPALQNYTIAGYQIEVTFDPNLVAISDVLDATNSGELFSSNIKIVDGIGKVLVASASGGSIENYDKLFFIPITLKGSALEPTSISVKYIDVRDTSLHKIQIPTLENLPFQRGKIYNGELGKPNIADAVAGLQYLAMLRNPGMGLEEVNLVNMASIIEIGSNTNAVKPNIKDVIALIQYTVNLRNDYFQPANPPQQHVNFRANISNNEMGVKQLRLYDLESGDQVEILKGSDNTNFRASFTVTEASPNPWVIDNINFGDELFLKVRVTRNSFVGEQDVFENLFIRMGAIAEDNTTSINLNGLRSGDQVSLYQNNGPNGPQIGSTQSVGDASLPTVFTNVPILEEGYKFEISRTASVSSTGTTYRRPQDLIAIHWETDITENGLETITLQSLENGDFVNLYDSEGNPIAGKQGMPAGTDGKVIISGLPLVPYHVEVVRGGIHSHKAWVNPPFVHVNFRANISNNEMGVKQLRLYDLESGDQVEILKGSDNNVAFLESFTVGEESLNPIVFDNINFGDELFLKVRVTRSGFVGVQDVFENLFIRMGAIAEDNTTSINLNGLRSGDQVSLYQNNGPNGPQIGSTQSIGDASLPTVFTNVPILEKGYRFEISRTDPVSSTGTTYRRPQDLIAIHWETEITENGLETLTLQSLENGDLVNLYDSEGNPIAGKQGLTEVNGQVIISDLEPGVYHVQVYRRRYFSTDEGVIRWVNVPSPAGDGGSAMPPDTEPPVLQSTVVNNNFITVTFDEDLDTDSIPAPENFVVLVKFTTVSVSNVSVSNKSVILTLSTGVNTGDTVTVSYIGGMAPVQDLAGNSISNLVNQTVGAGATT